MILADRKKIFVISKVTVSYFDYFFSNFPARYL